MGESRSCVHFSGLWLQSLVSPQTSDAPLTHCRSFGLCRFVYTFYLCYLLFLGQGVGFKG